MSGLVEEEFEIACPYCGEAIFVLVDGSVSHQTYIEDCSVCCRPMQITVAFEGGQMVSLESNRS